MRPGGAIVYSTCTLSPAENEAVVAASGLSLESERLVLPHRDRTDGFYIARLRRLMADEIGMTCPNCREPWLRPANLPGRYRCVYCLHRFELCSLCPDCGEHSTIVRMSKTAILSCNACSASMLREI